MDVIFRRVFREVNFVLMFKTDVLEKSLERHPPDVTLRRLYDVFGMLLQNL